jgi:tetratricopeptide (TPR) repeat protein
MAVESVANGLENHPNQVDMNTAANSSCGDRRVGLGLLLVFFAVAIGLYYPGFHAPMYYDSLSLIQEKEPVFAQHDLVRILQICLQRPIPIVSFYLNYLVGGMKPDYFRLLNVALLAMTALGLWRIMDHLLDMPQTWQRGSPALRTCLSAALSFLFLIHPYQVFVTLYIWQRMALMACLFGYWSLAVYLGVRLGKWRNQTLGYGICLLLLVCACLSKENSVVLPGMFVLAEVAFFGANVRQVVGRVAVYALTLLAVAGALSFLESPYVDSRHGIGIVASVTSNYQLSRCTFAEVILTQARVVFTYLVSILLPTTSSIQLIHAQVISTSILQPATTLSAVAAVLALTGAGLYGLFKRPLLGFGTLFFLVSLVPEALLVPQYAHFGYRAVFPMLGICLVLADTILLILDAASKRHLLHVAGVGFIALWVVGAALTAHTTMKKVETWNKPLEFWQEMIDEFPTEGNIERRAPSQALFNLGVELTRLGDINAATVSFFRAVKADPQYADAQYNLGKSLVDLGMIDEALVPLQKAIELKPENWKAHNTLGVALARKNRLAEAVPHFKKAVELKPDDIACRKNLETALRELGILGKGQAQPEEQ